MEDFLLKVSAKKRGSASISKPITNPFDDDVYKMYDINEAIGFTKTYEGELKGHMDAFINIVCGHIKEQASKKSMYEDEVIVQRLYQLLAENGELHSPVQELINILDSLPDKEQGPMGFKIGQNY